MPLPTETICWETASHALYFDSSNGDLLTINSGGYVIPIRHSLWSFDKITALQQKQTVADSNAFIFFSEKKADILHLYWKNDSAKIHVLLENQDEQTAMKIEIHLTDGSKLFSVRFPVIGNIPYLSDNGEQDQLLLPWQNGFLIKNPIRNLLPKKGEMPFWCGRDGRKYENEYPAQYSFQFSAYYSDQIGLYFATKDPDAYTKTIGYYLTDNNDSFDYSVTHYPEDMGMIESYSLPYYCLFDTFRGDWQVAAERYRQWALQQKWCPELLQNQHLSDNITSPDLWRINHTNFALGTRTDEYIETCRFLKNYLGCKIALHWYGWNQGRHDYEYPEYINPSLTDWPQKLKEYNQILNQEGFIKIPYVNARLWDSHTPGWAAENAIADSIKNERGELPDEPWNNGTVLRPMCPATNHWRQKVTDFADKYVKNFDFDGLYVDQVASYNATLCFDQNHQHPIGGGTWWADSYQQMMRQLRSKLKDGQILTSESCCEVYSRVFDLFLVLDTNMQTNVALAGGEFSESIPLFNMIYGQHMLTYGSICLMSNTAQQFEFNCIRNLLWGVIPSIDGFSMEELRRDDAQAYLSVLKQAVLFYHQYKEDILYSRPAKLITLDCPTLTIEWEQYDGVRYQKDYPSVQVVEWERPNGTRFCLAYNYGEQPFILEQQSGVILEPHRLTMMEHGWN